MTNKPKYRLLTKDELISLQPEFVQYLASQGITADQWQRYQENEYLQIDHHLKEFSDRILSTIYRSCRLIESVSQNTWVFYSFNDDRILMRGLYFEHLNDLDLRRLSKEELANWYHQAPQASVKLIRAEKIMESDKSFEVHELLQQGAFISDNHSMHDTITALYHED